MGVLAFRKQRYDLRSALHTLRNHGSIVNGPYRRQNGTFVFSIANCVITEDEMLRLQDEGKLEANDLQEFLAEIGKRTT
jgi:hypothetical protein